MRAVLQRCMQPAEVKVDGQVTGSIEKGLVVYLGVGPDDNDEDIKWLAKKVVNMRIFSDEADKMNLSLAQIGGGLLVISQFTLYASTKKGNRPSYMASAPPALAETLYERFLDHLRSEYGYPVGAGIFGADMKVDYINDGPVTIIIDSKQKT